MTKRGLKRSSFLTLFPLYRALNFYFFGIVCALSERSEFSAHPKNTNSRDVGAFFFGSVSFGQTKEMNAFAAAINPIIYSK